MLVAFHSQLQFNQIKLLFQTHECIRLSPPRSYPHGTFPSPKDREAGALYCGWNRRTSEQDYNVKHRMHIDRGVAGGRFRRSSVAIRIDAIVAVRQSETRREGDDHHRRFDRTGRGGRGRLERQETSLIARLGG